MARHRKHDNFILLFFCVENTAALQGHATVYIKAAT